MHNAASAEIAGRVSPVVVADKLKEIFKKTEKMVVNQEVPSGNGFVAVAD